MTEIAISVAAKVAEYLVAPIARPFSYLWNHKSNFENLKNEVKKLEVRRDSVQHSVEDARRNGEEIEKHVESWLDNVKNTIDEASELINGDDHHQQQQADMKCFKGFSCINLKKRYQHSQKAARLKAGVAGVREEAGEFEKVSYRTIPEETWIESSNNYEAFEERNNLLTNEMDSQHNFHVEALKEADAWSLFKNIAGTCTDHLDLQQIAFNVVKKCGGVPIAIVTVAKALKNKEIYEWNNALQELRKPSWKNFQGAIAKEVYTSIKLSYNYLESDELKATFLLCSSMGCTYYASIRDLLRYGIGLSLFVGLDTMEAATNRVATLVSKLKSSSLLLDTPDSEWFAMHDVARSIASQNEHVFTVIDDFIPRDWVYENTLENCTRISLHNIIELPDKLVCPKLMFLYIKSKVSFLRIHDQFFLEMPKLQVLHLVEMYLRSLPMSLGRLVNLKTLCLEKCKLRDATIIGVLKKLEILSFRDSRIVKLPEEMRQLIS
ncbi:hypothetical protein Ddye_025533 [Dipteronia dyeriana]|uniref:NB-ARC domain-containing protein n=1 Tax=Dipteronia dyeriana TaxID=168575 RepID=A0AAD9TKY5_9ROSI|nr:hypothetical protein Ddye_025533 [Dipteronia dyeriana]